MRRGRKSPMRILRAQRGFEISISKFRRRWNLILQCQRVYTARMLSMTYPPLPLRFLVGPFLFSRRSPLILIHRRPEISKTPPTRKLRFNEISKHHPHRRHNNNYCHDQDHQLPCQDPQGHRQVPCQDPCQDSHQTEHTYRLSEESLHLRLR